MVFLWGRPYPDAPVSGFWGTPTSTIDWCEENYVVTHYIAELVNTTTNSAFIALATYAFFNALYNRHGQRFLLVCAGFITVGIGSWMFHMSLLYEYQLLDELPMIYATCVPYWVVFSHGKSRADSTKVGLQISAAALTLTAVYLQFRDPTIHQVAYAVLNAVVLFKSMSLKNAYVKDEKALADFRKLLIRGLTYIALGYLCWNTDINFCSMYRGARRAVGMPYGFLLEGHGWWHFGTGLGVYHYIVYLEYLRAFLCHREHEYELKWSWKIIPHLDLKPEYRVPQVNAATKKQH